MIGWSKKLRQSSPFQSLSNFLVVLLMEMPGFLPWSKVVQKTMHHKTKQEIPPKNSQEMVIFNPLKILGTLSVAAAKNTH